MKHSFERYCKDYKNIENYEKALADNFKGWECHHRLETHTPEGERRLVDIPQKELKALNLYYHRPSEELIFLTTREHNALRKVSSETRKKLSEANKGKPKSEEAKKKMREAKKGKHHSAETKKKMAESHKGKNLGNTSTKGMCWFNNGKINKVCYECPPGFIPGRLRK